jgi:formamidopyrimidine-DNA glycosylase
MPELPEVEMAARELREWLLGRTILRAQLLRAGLAPQNSPESFARTLKGARVVGISRRGKHILTHLSHARTLITHLRMTGRFLDLDPADPHPPHTHAIFWLDNGRKILFSDQRHFGWMHLARSAQLDEVEQLRRLAPEPLDPQFSSDYLYDVLHRSRRAIKLILLDQTRVLGLGNIYAAEALFKARVNPRVEGARLSRKRTELLHREIVNVLRLAIASQSKAYGENDESWAVYDREGEPCRSCSGAVKRFTQGGRSTYYCPRCQSR